MTYESSEMLHLSGYCRDQKVNEPSCCVDAPSKRFDARGRIRSNRKEHVLHRYIPSYIYVNNRGVTAKTLLTTQFDVIVTLV